MNAIKWTEKQSLFRLFPLIISISFAMDVFVPAIPEMSRFFKIDNTTMQASLYLFMLTVAFGQLLIGPLSDRFGRRFMALCSAFLFLWAHCLHHTPQRFLFLSSHVSFRRLELVALI